MPKIPNNMSRFLNKPKSNLSSLTTELEQLSISPEQSKNSPTAKRGTLYNALFSPKSQGKLSSHQQSGRSYKVLSYLNKKKKKERGSQSLTKMVTKVSSSVSDCPNKSELLYKEHLFQTFQSMKFIRNLAPVNQSLLSSKTVQLSRRPGFSKTIIFDLDETLVHCIDNQSSPDVVLHIDFPNGAFTNAGINIRPYARECLAEASKLFEVMIFTASHRCYADVVLNYLDPTHELIQHRLYRDNCLPVQGVLMKDLRILEGRDLKDLVIVDNAAYSFGYQLENGIPIISWIDDYNDKELYNLIDYLKILAQSNDVRDVNRQTFRLRTFYEDYANEFIDRH